MSGQSPNKHQQKTEATKKKLIKAAQRVFARDGFEAASIDDIAGEAGYTRGAFYAHFETKEDLFFAMMEERATVLLEQLRLKLQSVADDEHRLALLRNFYASHIADPQWGILLLEFKLYVARRGKLRAKLAERYRSVKDKIKVQYLENMLPSGLECSPEHGERKRILLEAALNGLVLERTYDPRRIGEEEAKRLLEEVFDFAIRL